MSNLTPAEVRPSVAEYRERVRSLFPAIQADLEALVRIPSISNRSFDQAPVERCAEVVADLMRGVGLDAEILRARVGDYEGAPAVVARRPAAPGAPTVLLYAHHDVQPTGDRADWDSEPFEPTVRDGRLCGRGAADDKAGVVAHLGALRALAPDFEAGLGLGVTVFIEGEEEVGSPTFRQFLEDNAEALAADVIVVADSTNWKIGVPALTTSLRGLVDLDVTVRVLAHAVHSGMFGGPVLDAVTLMARLIATLHDDGGNVAVAGLVSGPEPQVDQDEAEFRAETSLLPGVPLVGEGTVTGRMWTKPAIAVIGLDAPSVATASNTIAPAATAKLSLRIPPGQDPDAALGALTDHLMSHAPFGARVEVRGGTTGQAFVASADTPAMRSARWAITQAWGRGPVDVGQGGSIPFIADLAEVFPEAAILVTGVGDPGSCAHGANESMDLGELEKVVLAQALALRALADGAPPPDDAVA